MTEQHRITVRFAEPRDARGILEAHYSAVHQTAAKDYPAGIRDEWSSPVTAGRIDGYLKHSLPTETTVVAEVNGRIAGFGSIVESKDELRAVYISAEFGGIGVGAALLSELERLAKERGCKKLDMVASVTAENFYRRHGFKVVSRGEHALSSGSKMACVAMTKDL